MSLVWLTVIKLRASRLPCATTQFDSGTPWCNRISFQQYKWHQVRDSHVIYIIHFSVIHIFSFTLINLFEACYDCKWHGGHSRYISNLTNNNKIPTNIFTIISEPTRLLSRFLYAKLVRFMLEIRFYHFCDKSKPAQDNNEKNDERKKEKSIRREKKTGNSVLLYSTFENKNAKKVFFRI